MSDKLFTGCPPDLMLGVFFRGQATVNAGAEKLPVPSSDALVIY